MYKQQIVGMNNCQLRIYYRIHVWVVSSVYRKNGKMLLDYYEITIGEQCQEMCSITQEKPDTITAREVKGLVGVNREIKIYGNRV